MQNLLIGYVQCQWGFPYDVAGMSAPPNMLGKWFYDARAHQPLNPNKEVNTQSIVRVCFPSSLFSIDLKNGWSDFEDGQRASWCELSQKIAIFGVLNQQWIIKFIHFIAVM